MKKIKILYAEDEKSLGTIVKESLETRAFEVYLVENGNDALEAFYSASFDVLVLDVMMPKMDGFTLGKKIRQINHTIPIIYLTAKSQTQDVIDGFSAGGNDYIRKPFSIEELIVRINALVARSSSKPQIIAIGNYTYHTKSQELYFENTSIPMTYRETEVLHLLTLNINEVVQKDILLTKIWGKADFFNGRSLDVFITKLRKKLSLDPTIKIINCRGQGYKLFVG